jgi:hypothetical protein
MSLMTQLSIDQVRPLVFRAFAEKQPPPSSVIDTIEAVRNLGVASKLMPVSTRQDRLPGRGNDLVKEVLWEMLTRALLIPRGPHWGSLTNFALTEAGKCFLQSARLSPYDDTAYLRYVDQTIPNFSGSVRILLSESLQTFKGGYLVASVVLLGSASEQIVFDLFEYYKNAHSDKRIRNNLQERWNRKGTIRTKFDLLWSELEQYKSELNAVGLWDGTDGLVKATFHAIRVARNEALHPPGRQFDAVEVDGVLSVFIPYAKRVYALMEYLGKANL